MAKTPNQLAERLKELDDDREFVELNFLRIEVLSEKAALLIFIEGEKAEWMPYSHMRHLDGLFYATEWIIDQKGLD